MSGNEKGSIERENMKQFTDFAIAYKLVWFRVMCYFAVPAGTLFLTQTETYSEETWAAMGSFLRSRLMIACCIAGAMSLCAYLDQSLNKARGEHQSLKVDRELKKNTYVPEPGKDTPTP
jgi:hypothetical protein